MSAEFHLQGKAQKGRVRPNLCLFTAQNFFLCSYFMEIRQISAFQNAAILIKAWRVYTQVMTGIFDLVSI